MSTINTHFDVISDTYEIHVVINDITALLIKKICVIKLIKISFRCVLYIILLYKNYSAYK